MCLVCGMRAARERWADWCSRDCRRIGFGLLEAATFVCPRCGREKTVPANRLATRKLCSRSCACAWNNATNRRGPANGRWRGGSALSYGPGWKKIKVEIRARDKVCRRWGKTPEENGRALDVHHLEPFRFSGDNSPDELEALCHSCQMRADDHGRRGSARFLRAPVPKRPTKREIKRLKQLLRATEARARRETLKEQAEQLRAHGHTLRQIESALGVSRQTSRNWLTTPSQRKRRRRQRDEWRSTRAADARALRARGLSLRAIARQLGVSGQTVREWPARDEGVAREAAPRYAA